ncbi:MAG: hypothetical protein M1833_005118 [Piccolia ochrophora]|nr:MAG: hypothetical protein M1833_005118 [Piccolia ochrophora]
MAGPPILEYKGSFSVPESDDEGEDVYIAQSQSRGTSLDGPTDSHEHDLESRAQRLYGSQQNPQIIVDENVRAMGVAQPRDKLECNPAYDRAPAHSETGALSNRDEAEDVHMHFDDDSGANMLARLREARRLEDSVILEPVEEPEIKKDFNGVNAIDQCFEDLEEFSGDDGVLQDALHELANKHKTYTAGDRTILNFETFEATVLDSTIKTDGESAAPETGNLPKTRNKTCASDLQPAMTGQYWFADHGPTRDVTEETLRSGEDSMDGQSTTGSQDGLEHTCGYTLHTHSSETSARGNRKSHSSDIDAFRYGSPNAYAALQSNSCSADSYPDSQIDDDATTYPKGTTRVSLAESLPREHTSSDAQKPMTSFDLLEKDSSSLSLPAGKFEGYCAGRQESSGLGGRIGIADMPDAGPSMCSKTRSRHAADTSTLAGTKRKAADEAPHSPSSESGFACGLSSFISRSDDESLLPDAQPRDYILDSQTTNLGSAASLCQASEDAEPEGFSPRKRVKVATSSSRAAPVKTLGKVLASAVFTGVGVFAYLAASNPDPI